MKYAPIALAAMMVATPAAATDIVEYNSTPDDTWFFGSGNDYNPANTVVLTTHDGDQMYLRFHRTFQTAPISTGNVYSFALGTDPLSFDWGIDNNTASQISALLTLTNIGTGQTFSYDPFNPLNDNATGNGSSQNSFRFNWIPGLFDPNLDNTYRVDLDVNGLNGGGQRQLSALAQFGVGAGAVPEPSTWAMLILGFGLIGGAMRRRANMTVSYS